jgi:glycerol-3-phosphate acyltransferase PlsY
MLFPMALYFTIAAVAYLLGSIPFGLILAKVFLRTDVRTVGSGNIGATNVMRAGSKGLGIATLLLDAAKGYVAVEFARAAVHRTAGAGDAYTLNLALGLAALCAMLGHVFPVWLKFKGGKGVATGVGVFLALVPQAVAIVLVIFVLIFALSHYVSLASIIATASFPVVTVILLRRQAYWLMPFIVAAAVLIIAKHYTNIRRLLSGTEHRIEFGKR